MFCLIALLSLKGCIVTLFRDQQISYNFFCYEVDREHITVQQAGFDAPKTLLTRIYKFSKNYFLCVSHV